MKRLLTWYYRRKVDNNEKRLKDLRTQKSKILDQVMETETYKVAKEIMELYAPDQLRQSLVIEVDLLFYIFKKFLGFISNIIINIISIYGWVYLTKVC